MSSSQLIHFASVSALALCHSRAARLRDDALDVKKDSLCEAVRVAVMSTLTCSVKLAFSFADSNLHLRSSFSSPSWFSFSRSSIGERAKGCRKTSVGSEAKPKTSDHLPIPGG
eukprot:scaffold14346_cov33-Tisochrysis_lutea.AAC.2